MFSNFILFLQRHRQMKEKNPFNLEVEIQRYFNQLHSLQLSHSENLQGLVPQFVLEIEDLKSADLSDKEAFEIAKMRFFGREITQVDHQKVQPGRVVYKYLFSGLITYFILNIMWSSAPLTSDTILLFVKAESLNPIFAKYLDFGLKMAIIMGSAYYLIRQIRVGRINKYALACIPFVGLLLDFASLPIRSLGLALHHNSDIYPILAGSFATNSKIIMLISWTLLIGFTAFLWRKHYSHIRLTN